MNAQEWADRLIAEIPEDARWALARDPLGTIPARFPLRLAEVATPPARRGNRGVCDGFSILDQGTLFYVPTLSNRQNFTALHELGHHLTRRPDVLDWAADRDDPKRVIEEICDRIAATLLLPLTAIDATLSGVPLAATHVRDLYTSSVASREVCAIALSRRLGCEGAVAIVDLYEKRITFAARVAETRPYPWRDDPLPLAHKLRRLIPDGTIRGESWWPYADGEQRTYYLDAVAESRYAYAVFAVTDRWGVSQLHIAESPPRATHAYSRQISCVSCGYTGETRRFPCEDCHQPPCPRCGACACARRLRDTVVCPGCYLRRPRREMVGRVCRECVGRGKVV